MKTYKGFNVTEVESYLNNQGYSNDLKIIKSLIDTARTEQLIEAIQNNYCILDYDEWQHLQNILKCEMDFDTAIQLGNTLWNENIHTFDVDGKDIEKYLNKGLDNMTIIKNYITDANKKLEEECSHMVL